MCEAQTACVPVPHKETEDAVETLEERAFAAFVAHVAACLVGRVECSTLGALACTCRAASCCLRAPLGARTRAVWAAGCLLWARTTVDWLVRPTACLDDFVRLALYDQHAGKLAEVKLSRVHHWVFIHPEFVLPGTDNNIFITGVGHVQRDLATRVAMWRCAPPWPTGTPRQTMSGRMMSSAEGTRAVYALLQAGFRPLRRRGFYNTGMGEPLWGRP